MDGRQYVAKHAIVEAAQYWPHATLPTFLPEGWYYQTMQSTIVLCVPQDGDTVWCWPGHFIVKRRGGQIISMPAEEFYRHYAPYEDELTMRAVGEK